MSQSQKVLVAGTGLSGISAAKLLLDMGERSYYMTAIRSLMRKS